MIESLVLVGTGLGDRVAPLVATPPPPRSPVSLIALVLLCASAGYGLGVSGVLGPFAPQAGSPAARLGEALQGQQPGAGNGSQIADDAAIVRESLPGPARSALDLLVKVSGISSEGNTDWKATEALCQELQWERCDREALSELKMRSGL